MKKQLNRIDSFVKSIQASRMSDDQEAIVLTGNIEAIGGHNLSNCENKNTVDCSGTNNGCTNHGVCLDGSNFDCKNTEIPTPRPGNNNV